MGTTDELDDESLVPLGAVLDAIDRRQERERKNADEAAEKSGVSPTYVTDAERALIGSVLLDGKRVLDTCEDEGLCADDFYTERHRLIFDAMTSLNLKKRELSPISVMDELNRRAQLDIVGGPSYLTALVEQSVTAAPAASHARLIVEKSRLRGIMVACEKAIGRARLGEAAHDIIDTASSILLNIERSSRRTDIVDLKAVGRQMMNHLPAFGGVDTSRKSGFVDLDGIMKMRPGDLIILAGRPSMGKTQLGIDISNHFALDRGEPVTFFSLEMDAEQLMQRHAASRARMNLGKKKMYDNELSRASDAIGEVADSPLHIDDTPGMTIGEIRSKARAIDRRFGTRLIVVDYLQLVSSDKHIDNKAIEVGEISKGLKTLARELRAPMIALSQLNRGVEQRADKRPVMSDLRDSGAIEQDADAICFLFREEYYLKQNTPADMVGLAEAIVAKNRNGPTGTVKLHFNAEIPRFDNHSERDKYQ